MDRYKFYKGKEGLKGRHARKENMKINRKDQRLQMLEELRNIGTNSKAEPPPVVVSQKKSRLELLKEWKQEKTQKENQMKQTKKPPFYAGRLQTKATGSPKLASSNHSGTMTRSQVKASNATLTKPLESIKKKKPMKLNQLNKVDRNVLRPVENHAFVLPKTVVALQKLTIPLSPKIKKSARKSVNPLFETLKKENDGVSKTRQNQPKAKRMLLVSDATIVEAAEDLKSDEKMIATNTVSKESDVQMDYTPDNSQRAITNFDHLTYSPFIQKQRGSSRRSSKKCMTLEEKIDAEILEEEQILKSKIASFRLFLINETKRLLNLSETWLNYLQAEPNVPSDVEGDINAVAGKTKLLTSDKFKQFEGLIDKCEASDPMIKIDDLQGFHDWVSLEVEDLDKVFMKLDERKKNNWKVVDEIAKPLAVKKLAKQKPAKPSAPKRNVPSSMRAHIMAARKQMRGGEGGEMVPVVEKLTSPVTSPRTVVVGTPRDRSDLRVHVLQRCSGLSMLAATAAARHSLSPSKSPNQEQPTLKPTLCSTPSKSILRKTPTSAAVKRNVIFGGTIDPKYFLPADDSSEESPTVLTLVDSETPPMTPRRSMRIARKSTK